MFQEEIADITAGHLRSHITANLAAVQLRHADTTRLVDPKAIETANLVGGVYNASRKAMPAYAVDIIDKSYAGADPDGLWIYNYTGHIAGIVSSSTESGVNKLVKRHEEAVELFIKEHLHLQGITNALNGDFTILELGFVGAAFSGGEEVPDSEEPGKTVWIAGFRVDLLWSVSETGPGDPHDS